MSKDKETWAYLKKKIGQRDTHTYNKIKNSIFSEKIRQTSLANEFEQDDKDTPTT